MDKVEQKGFLVKASVSGRERRHLEPCVDFWKVPRLNRGNARHETPG